MKRFLYILLFIGFSLNAQIPNNEVPFNTTYQIKSVTLDSTLVIMRPISYLKIGELSGNGIFKFLPNRKTKEPATLEILKCKAPIKIYVDVNINLIISEQCENVLNNNPIEFCLNEP